MNKNYELDDVALTYNSIYYDLHNFYDFDNLNKKNKKITLVLKRNEFKNSFLVGGSAKKIKIIFEEVSFFKQKGQKKLGGVQSTGFLPNDDSSINIMDSTLLKSDIKAKNHLIFIFEKGAIKIEAKKSYVIIEKIL